MTYETTLKVSMGVGILLMFILLILLFGSL